MEPNASLTGLSWVNKQLGKYKVIKLLGCGGMGAVYQANHTLLDKIVCLKLLFPALIYAGQNMVERFLREAKAIARLEHANIVRIYDVEQENDLYFIVMEYIEGQTLTQILEEKEMLSFREALRITIEIAEALAAAHSQNIVHRDVKPANIMINKDGKVKLTDFGLAISIDISGKISNTGELWGTPIYLSPEYIKGEALDNRTDIYSLGVMLFHMLAGEPPYTGRNPISIIHQHLDSPIPSIRKQREDAPSRLEKIIEKSMAKTLQKRYACVEDMIGDLKACFSKVAAKHSKRIEKVVATEEKDLPPVASALNDEVAAAEKIRVLIVDDSPTMCKAIGKILQEQPTIDVRGFAYNGKEALEMIPQLDPQVITLDYNMALMDGTTTLKQIMTRYPRPVIMLSAFTYEGALTSFDCLSYGAIDFIWKTSKSHRQEFKNDLVHKICCAARIQLHVQNKPRVAKTFGGGLHKLVTKNKPAKWLVVMGAGEGGYHSCLKIIPHIPKNFPGAIVLVQEMPDEMTSTFANYLNHYSKVIVKQVEHLEVLTEGVCYITNHLSPLKIAPHTEHETFTIVNGKETAPKDGIFADTLSQAADNYGHRMVGVILTGKRQNALKALKRVKHIGGKIVVQSPNTCLNADGVLEMLGRKVVAAGVKDVDIPSVLWHVLKKYKK